MDASDLPENLLRFLQTCAPAFPAVELLLFMAGHREDRWRPAEIVEQIKPIVIPLPQVLDYLNLFKTKGLIDGDFDRGFAYAPASKELESAVAELTLAYNERPVTLIRTIYALAENKIQSFADSFRLKNE